MGNFAKAINNRFATSVKNQVDLSYGGQRVRGSARETIHVCLKLAGSAVMYTHGSISCTGIYRDSNADEREDRLILEAMAKYNELSIDEIVNSRNPIIRALGMLDARLGKQRLSKMNVKHESRLIQQLFCFRCTAEKVSVATSEHAVTALRSPAYAAREGVTSKEQRLERILVIHKRRQNIVDMLSSEIQNGGDIEKKGSRVAIAIAKSFKGKQQRLKCLEALKVLSNSTKLVEESYIMGLVELLRDYPAWLRPLSEWKPRTHNADRQFHALARHLFARYDVPAFMDEAWMQGQRLHQNWFKHIGEGKNIRTAEELPVPLTKMMAHQFLTAPGNYTINGAFRWAQALAMGADRQMAHAIVETRISETFKDNDFWVSVIGFFARNPMLDTAQVGPIIDYIWNQKYEDVTEFVERGVAVNRGPAQPNYSMKGRTAMSLLHAVERWHRDVNNRKAGGALLWAKSGVGNLDFVEGSADSKNMKLWRISELLSSAELAAEGSDMRHCVATYAQSCHSGHCGIWSMTLRTHAGTERVVTIEVQLRTRVIRQVRGKLNRLPTAKEREIIQRWAAKEGLDLQ